MPELRWAGTREDLEGALALRERVFCREQGVPREEEIDGHDGEAAHLVAFEADPARVVATLRLLSSGAVAKIGRVAVAADRRRRGIASTMLAEALARARAEGCREARLAAQTDAIELYRQAGFAIVSETFMEAGIEHVWMSLEL